MRQELADEQLRAAEQQEELVLERQKRCRAEEEEARLLTQLRENGTERVTTALRVSKRHAADQQVPVSIGQLAS